MEESEIYALFAKRKKRRQFLNIFIVTSFIVFLLLSTAVRGLDDTVANLISLIALIIFLAPLVIMFIDWRCPNCDELLGRQVNITYCNHCGVRLTEYRD